MQLYYKMPPVKALYLCCTLVAISSFDLTFVAEGAGAVKRSEFGEHCNETFKCNKNSWLTCKKENKCDCAFFDEMVFDTTAAKCVSKAGERCKYGIDDTIYQKSDCVPHASCTDEGVCSCDPFHYEIANGTCRQQGAIGEPCVDDLTCRRDKHLTCLNGTCGCDPDASEASNDGNGHCVGLAEKDCLSQRCTLHASCHAVSKTCMCTEGHYQDDKARCHPRKQHLYPCDGHFECQSFLACLNGSCICNPSTGAFSLWNPPVRAAPEFVETGNCNSGITTSTSSSGQLYIQSPNYPQTYMSGIDCSWLLTADPDQLITFSFQDMDFGSYCHYGTVTIYDGNSTNTAELTQVCERQISDPVKSSGNQMFVRMTGNSYSRYRGFKGAVVLDVVAPRPTIPECVGLARSSCSPNKNCVKNAECSTVSICGCKAGYVATSTGFCGFSYGAACDQTENICSDAYVCTEGKCNCHYPDHQINVGDNCLSLTSGPCLNNTDCLPGAQCSWRNISNIGSCTCKDGLLENFAGTCELAYGAICKHGLDVCDTYAGLQCRNGFCKCPDEAYHYEVTTRRCVGLVGSRCSETGKMKRCVENAECFVSHSGLPGVCKCMAKFEETSERRCSGVA